MSARQLWPVLVLVTTVPPLLAVLLVLLSRSVIRWVVLGSSLTLGPCIAVVLTLLVSGVAPRVMGTTGEQWTALELRRLEKRGWRVLTGLTLKERQIDHLAVGSAGVLVVESKWSADHWHITPLGDRFARDRLQAAIEQTKQNKFHVEAVLVLWSAPARERPESAPQKIDGVTVLLGRDLAAWLDSLEGPTQAIDVAACWSKIEQMASTGDALDAARGLAPSLRFERWLLIRIGAPVLAAFAALCAFGAADSLRSTDAPFIESALAVIIGLVGLHWRSSRMAAIAWTTTAAGMLVIALLGLLVGSGGR
jgi:Nuclease-related domain